MLTQSLLFALERIITLTKNKQPRFYDNNPNNQRQSQLPAERKSVLDLMVDGKEYNSIIEHPNAQCTVNEDLRVLLKDIEQVRQRPIIAYVANIISPPPAGSISIDNSDDFIFEELLRSVPTDQTSLDILLVTPGGSAEKVARFVNILRNRFHDVAFILPYLCQSAGTIFCLSGEELIMSEGACIGPIDPQVPGKDGRYVPAQSILTLLDRILADGLAKQVQGLSPNWTDVQLILNMDPKEVGNAHNASKFSIDLVTDYLQRYKFRKWTTHSSSGKPVTDKEKVQRAQEIAGALCDHQKWLSHSREITRSMATELGLRITNPEEVPQLDRAIRRFWAATVFLLERSSVIKLYMSTSYTTVRKVVQQGA